MNKTSDFRCDWEELTPAGVLERYPPPDEMTHGLNSTDAQQAREAYGRHCIDVIKQAHGDHGHTTAEETEMLCRGVGDAMAELVANGTLRGELH
ncbi:hypothetical protein [Halomonas cupida]|uniref:hypothetical protein n=1 Tax=Halomonas cupida TaxID=44933 RepID=UPI003A955C85